MGILKFLNSMVMIVNLKMEDIWRKLEPKEQLLFYVCLIMSSKIRFRQIEDASQKYDSY